MLKAWFIATRPWSFTAAFVPIAVGSALAWDQGFFNLWLFLLTAVGGICVQAGTNLINTYGDFKSGVDTVASAHTCPQLVTGAMKPADMKRAGLAVLGFAGIIALYLAWMCGWEVLAVGLLGIAGGYAYTAGPCPYKYKGWGTFSVFFLMGPLMCWPAWFIQTGLYSWLPVLAAVPVGFLVSAILNGNDVRDIADDKTAGISTLASGIGSSAGLRLQRLLLAGAFLSLAALVAFRFLPFPALLPFLLVPGLRNALRTIREAEAGRTESLTRLEAMAAAFHFQFGILLAAGLALHPWLAGKGF